MLLYLWTLGHAPKRRAGQTHCRIVIAAFPMCADPNDKEFAKEGKPALTGDELINAPGLSFQFLRKVAA